LIAHRTDVAFVQTPQEDDFINSELFHRHHMCNQTAVF
jgi:hypothetical protein